MSETKVEILENRRGRTEVYVGGKLAYESANPIPVEKKNIKRLLRMLDGDSDEEVLEVIDLDENKDLSNSGNSGSDKPN